MLLALIFWQISKKWLSSFRDRTPRPCSGVLTPNSAIRGSFSSARRDLPETRHPAVSSRAFCDRPAQRAKQGGAATQLHLHGSAELRLPRARAQAHRRRPLFEKKRRRFLEVFSETLSYLFHQTSDIFKILLRTVILTSFRSKSLVELWWREKTFWESQRNNWIFSETG